MLCDLWKEGGRHLWLLTGKGGKGKQAIQRIRIKGSGISVGKYDEYSRGYAHCIPNGKSSVISKLFPLHPGYVTTVCASVAMAYPATITDQALDSIVLQPGSPSDSETIVKDDG
jgi:hypothetical protein